MKLSPTIVAARLRELQGTGTVDSRQLRKCGELCTALEEVARADNALPFPKALATLYPDSGLESAMDAFRIWRSRLNRRLGDANATFRLAVSQNRRLPLDERLFWFEGEDRTVATFNEFGNAEARLDGPIEPARGRPRTIIYFVSYAHADRDAVGTLLKRLQLRLARSEDFVFVPWRDVDDMVPGEVIPDEVERAIDSCQISLQMVSYEYMASEFIRKHERHRFADGKECASDSGLRLGFPIAIDHPDFENADWWEFGRNKRGLFLHDGKSYQELRESDYELRERNRDAFADACAKKIVQAARRYLGDSEDDTPPSERLTDEAMRESVSIGIANNYVPALGHETRMQQIYRSEAEGSPPLVPGIPVLYHLLNWATIRRRTSLFALLGEYGMGKTVNCKRLTLKLLELRKQAEAGSALPPMPVYLDMRYARGLFRSETLQQGSRRFDHVEIDDLVGAIFRECWKSRETPDAADLRRLIAGGNVLIVFDGFDEVAAHLHPDEAQSLIRTMWSLLPADALSPDVERRPMGTKAVQMLISCRTHYFRDVTQQANLFTGHQRDLEHGADLYDAMTLLPFSDKQIESFLTIKLRDGGKARRALDTIRHVHNLPDLARRPLLLDRICGQLERIETLAAAGKKINAARLYDLLADEWLARDNAKHTFDAEIKKVLMARLAGAMWRTGERLWPAGEVEVWLDGELRSDPRLKERYANLYRGKAREILYEDLRTSTFVVRSDDGDFRFAHTSILEYFLAKYMFLTLHDGDGDAWEGIEPSPECLEFLAEIACENAREGEKRRFFGELGALLRRSYRPGISEVAFRVVLDAQRRGETAAPLGRYRLEGANLAGWNIASEDSERRIDLSGSDFTGAALKNLQIGDVIARNCVFDSATLEFANLERVDLSGSSFKGIRAFASVFRQCWMSAVQGSGATWRNATFLHCRNLNELAISDDQPGGPLVVSGNSLGLLHAQCGSSRLQAQASPHLSVGGCAFSPDGTRGVFCGYASTLCLWHVDTGEKMAVLQGHTGRVWSCAFSPDGARVVSGSDDSTLRVWDGETGESIAVLRGHSGPVQTCAFSPDGTRIVSGSNDRTLRMWNGETGDEIAVLLGHFRPVRTCAFSPDGTRMVSGSNDRTLRLWNGETGDEIAVLRGHTQRVGICAYRPDGTRIVSGSDDGALRLWNGETGTAIGVLQGHTAAVSVLAFSPDGTHIISGSEDGALRLHSGTSGAETAVLQGHTQAVSTCAFSPDGRRIVSGSNDGTLCLCSVETGEAIIVPPRRASRVGGCSFSPDGTQVVSWSNDCTLRLLDGQTGEEVAVVQTYTVPVTTFAFSPDGTRIASGSTDSTLHLWDVETGERLAALQGHTHGVEICAFSSDGTRIISGGRDSTLRLWEGESGEQIAVLQGHTSGVTAWAVSSDGAHVVAACRDTVNQWDTKSGEKFVASQDRLKGDWTCAFNPEGTRAVFGGLGPVRLCNLETGEEIAVLEGHEGGSLACAFSPDGTRIVYGSRDMLYLWDAETGQRLAVFQGHTNGLGICAFSADGKRIVSGSIDGTLHLWDVESGEGIAVLRGHTEGVRALAFSPDGTRVLSGSDDNSLRMWSVETGNEITILQGHTGGVLTCAFSLDGTHVVSGSNDGTLRLWNVATAKAVVVFYHLPDGGYLVYSEHNRQVLGASGSAWRYFRWLVPDRKPYPLLPLEADPRIGAIPRDGYRASAIPLAMR